MILGRIPPSQVDRQPVFLAFGGEQEMPESYSGGEAFAAVCKPGGGGYSDFPLE